MFTIRPTALVLRGVVTAAGAFLCLCTVTPAKAVNVFIDDLTDKVSVSSSSGSGLSTITTNNEMVSFTFTSAQVSNNTQSVYIDLIEAGSNTLSDRLLVTQTNGSNVLTVKFASDPSALSVGGATFLGTVTEDGTYQQLVDYSVSSGGPVVDSFYVRSDVAETPEPGTVAQLVGMGVLGSGLRLRRRRK